MDVSIALVDGLLNWEWMGGTYILACMHYPKPLLSHCTSAFYSCIPLSRYTSTLSSNFGKQDSPVHISEAVNKSKGFGSPDRASSISEG
jgi:hypothetical protein